MLNIVEIDERIEKCDRILKENPQSQIFAALADALRKKGELDAAFKVCRQGLRMHPNYGGGRLVMARICFDRRMYDWAERELAEAVRLDGRTRAIDVLQVEIFIKRGLFSKAQVLLDEMKSSDPRNEYYRILQLEIDEGKADKKAALAATQEFYNQGLRSEKSHEAEDDLDDDQPMTFDRALEYIAKFPKVEAGFLTNSDGLLENSIDGEQLALDKCSAEMSEIVRSIANGLSSISFGDPEQILVESESRKYAIVIIGSRILVGVCESDVNIGSLKQKLMRISDLLRRD
jgi:predicted regulator of Ras-like GTPase activity (Roadblock/LC7/MglB family)